VVDVSHPGAEDQMTAVQDVLIELKAESKPTLVVCNKIDQLSDRAELLQWLNVHPGAVAVSARTGEGFEALLAELAARIRPEREVLDLAIPHEASAVLARAHAMGQILTLEHGDTVTRVKICLPPHLQSEFEPYLARENPPPPTQPR
jgi:GTP-binding protein HflX